MRLVALAVAVGASLVHTSIPPTSPPSHATSSLEVNVASERSSYRLAAARAGSVQTWVVPAPQGLGRAASARGVLPDGLEGVALTMKVGSSAPRAILTNAKTVGQLLDALRIRLRRHDRLRPGPEERVWAGMTVRVERIRRLIRTEVVAIPFRTMVRYTTELAFGRTRIAEAGRSGSAERTWRVVFRNGREVRRILLGERILAGAVDRLVLQGVNNAAQPDGGAQFGQASWYRCPEDGFFAAHLSLPRGTEVTVTNPVTGRSVTVVINDRGPYGVEGRIIDLCGAAFASLAPLAQGVMDVRISW